MYTNEQAQSTGAVAVIRSVNRLTKLYQQDVKDDRSGRLFDGRFTSYPDFSLEELHNALSHLLITDALVFGAPRIPTGRIMSEAHRLQHPDDSAILRQKINGDWRYPDGSGFLLLDYDNDLGLSEAEVRAALTKLPGWDQTGYIWAPSGSSLLSCDDEVIRPFKVHIVVVIPTARRAKDYIREASRVTGLAFDVSVGDPHALIYLSPASYVEPMVSGRAPAEFHLGGMLNIELPPEEIHETRPTKPFVANNDEQAMLIDALAAIEPDDDLTWRTVGMGLKVALGEDDGWDAFDAWSARNPESYDAAENLSRWKSFTHEQGDGVGAASIFYLAQQNGWTRDAFILSQMPAYDAPGVPQQPGDAAIKTVAVEDDDPEFDAMFSMAEPEKPVGDIFRHVSVDTAFPIRNMNTGAPVTTAVANIRHVFDCGGLRFSYDTFTHTQYILRTGARKKLDDNAYLRIWLMVQAAGLRAAKTLVFDCIDALAAESEHDSARDFFDSLPAWDGVERAESVFISQLGAADNEYTRAVTRLWWAAVVRRGRGDARKFDYLVILYGPQGLGKSTALRIILGDGFYEENLSLHHSAKEIIELSEGKLVCEIGELAGMRKTEREHVKSFVSRTTDTARGAYGRKAQTRERRFVCIGTANPEHRMANLRVEDRRMPFIVCNKRFDPGWLAENRLQILAEAVAIEKAYGHHLVLPDDIEEQAVTQRAEIAAPDPISLSLQTLFQGVESGKIEQKEVWALLGFKDAGAVGAYCVKNGGIVELMEKMGWTLGTPRKEGKKVKAFMKGDRPEWLKTCWTGQYPGVGIGSIEGGGVEPEVVASSPPHLTIVQ